MPDPTDAPWIRDYFEWADAVKTLYGKPPSTRDRTLYFVAHLIRAQHELAERTLPKPGVQQ